MAEIVDEFPGFQDDLDWITERFRDHGWFAGARALENRSHVMDFVRLSLEVFFLRYPNEQRYVVQQNSVTWRSDANSCPEESYHALRQLLRLLRARLN